MSDLEERQENYRKVSEALGKMKDAEIRNLLNSQEQGKTPTGNTAVLLEIAGVQVFAKILAVTYIEKESPNSTKNLHNLPAFYGIRVGSLGVSSNREVEAHKRTTDFVLNGKCANFPLTYGLRELPKKEKTEVLPAAELDGYVAYWAGSKAVKERVEAINDANNEVVIFMEAISPSPDLKSPTLAEYLKSENPDLEMVMRDLTTTIEFMQSKGMLHADSHKGNILTNGEQLFFTDFGLTMFRDFDLSDDERKQFEENLPSYDMASALTALKDQPAFSSYLPVINEVNEFFEKLSNDSTKTIAYPAKKIEGLLLKIFADKAVEDEKSKFASTANQETAGKLSEADLNKIAQKNLAVSPEQSAIAEMMQGASTIAHIAAKTTLAPNQLIEMYQKPDGKGSDIKKMSEDFGEGTAEAVMTMKQRHQDFEQSKEEENLGTFAAKYPSRSGAEGSFAEQHHSNGGSGATFVERVGAVAETGGRGS